MQNDQTYDRERKNLTEGSKRKLLRMKTRMTMMMALVRGAGDSQDE